MFRFGTLNDKTDGRPINCCNTLDNVLQPDVGFSWELRPGWKGKTKTPYS
jgi:hypothetical protein